MASPVNRCLVSVFCATWLLACSPQAQTAPTSAASQTRQATLQRVIDGDSIVVRDQTGKKQKIRLAGIDAPEYRQRYGAKSRQSLKAILGDHRLRLRIHKTDRYGRLVANVVVNGVDASLTQIKAGMAWFYRRYRQEQSKTDQQAFDVAENNARQARRGLWKQASPIAPWKYRQRKRQSQ